MAEQEQEHVYVEAMLKIPKAQAESHPGGAEAIAKEGLLYAGLDNSYIRPLVEEAA